MSRLSRREFLKLATAFSAGTLLTDVFPLGKHLASAIADRRPNIILFVFDAMSARNMSLYGYPRATTPNLERFAQRATVYHAHYSGGNFTTSGTASMLTGMYPWNHRALHFSGLVSESAASHNLFRLLGPDYYRYAFTQNLLADGLLRQFSADVDERLPATAFSLGGDDIPFDTWPPDSRLTLQVFQDHLFVLSTHVPASWLGGYLNSINSLRKTRFYRRGVTGYPYGAPVFVNYNLAFDNQTVYAGVTEEITRLAKSQQPYFAYIHLFSPHDPYNPQAKYTRLFNDNYRPPAKPVHPLGDLRSEEDVLKKRLRYDQLVANVDAEFGRLFDTLEASGTLDNTYLFVTSDHGEMFERGYHGHGDDLMYEGVIHIPLLILSPSQTKRYDVYTPTSNTDLLPTLLLLAGQEVPPSLDGCVLPGFADLQPETRPIFSIQAMTSSAFLPLTKGTFVLRRGDYKLIAYKGFPAYEKEFELYNLTADPEEMDDLYAVETSIAGQMRDELLSTLEDVNRLYRK